VQEILPRRRLGDNSSTSCQPKDETSQTAQPEAQLLLKVELPRIYDAGYKIQNLNHDFLTSELTTTTKPEDEASQTAQPEAQLLLKRNTSKEIKGFRMQEIGSDP